MRGARKRLFPAFRLRVDANTSNGTAVGYRLPDHARPLRSTRRELIRGADPVTLAGVANEGRFHNGQLVG